MLGALDGYEPSAAMRLALSALHGAARKAVDGIQEGLVEALAAVEAPLIAAAMERTHGNQLKAAELLGMNRNTLRERMRALGLKPRE